VLLIVGKIDGGHATAAELTLDTIATGKSRSQEVETIGHQAPRWEDRNRWNRELPAPLAPTRGRHRSQRRPKDDRVNMRCG
jgi:hypothetical protein